MSIEDSNKNDLLILEESYVNQVSEMSIYEERLLSQQEEIKTLKEQVKALKHLNNELMGFVKKTEY